MPNGISYSPDGTKFTLVIEDFHTLNTDNSAITVGPSDFLKLVDTLPHLPGAVRRGAAKPALGTGHALASGIGSGMAAYTGPIQNANLYNTPYYGNSTTACYYQTTDNSGNSITGVDIGYAQSKAGACAVTSRAMVGDILFQGTVDTATPFGADTVVMFGGTAHALYSTGTATFTTASKTISLGTAISAANQVDFIGSFIVNTQDTNPGIYRIVDCPTTTSVTVDRAYIGSRSGVASTFKISPVYNQPAVTGMDSSHSANVVGGSVLGAWGRLVLGNVITGAAQTKANLRPARIVWSGVIDSYEPYASFAAATTPFYGVHGFHATAYLDLAATNGAIGGLYRFGSAVVVLQERAFTAIYGSPTFDGPGSLDASQVYSGFSIVPYTGVETPYGFFFLDRVKGLCKWDGSGVPTRVESQAKNDIGILGATQIGYFNDYLLIGKGTYNTYGILFHIPTGRVSSIVDMQYTCLQRGRDQGRAWSDHYLVGYSSAGYIVNLSNMTNPGTGGNDGIIENVNVQLRSGVYGDPSVLLRAQHGSITYRLTDPGGGSYPPYMTLSVFSGVPSHVDFSEAYVGYMVDRYDATATSQGLPVTASGTINGYSAAATKTVSMEVSATAGRGVSVGIGMPNVWSGFTAIYRIVITGTVEGEGAS